MERLRSRLLAALIAAALLAACSLIKARPAATTPFLPHGDRLTEQDERAPFNGIWFAGVRKNAQLSTFKKMRTHKTCA